MNSIKIPEEFNYISSFLTFRCNLSCPYCLNAFEDDFSRKRNELSGEEWVENLNRIETNVPITFTGGEPLVHQDFIKIIKQLKPSLSIDILTNLYSNTEKYKLTLDTFVSEINPSRINKNSPYASIRVSYHPDQMNPAKLIDDVNLLKNAGFNVGIWAVLYPGPNQLSAINQMQFRCKDNGIDFRLKEFTGKYKDELYGNYSKYPDSIFMEKTKEVLCRTPELLISPNGDIYKCHRDLYSQEFSIGNITDKNFQAEYKFRKCNKYGQCHPCDVKLKTNHNQELGYTTVDIIKS